MLQESDGSWQISSAEEPFLEFGGYDHMKNIAEKSLCFLITACFALNVLPQSVIAEDTAGETPSPSPAAEMQTTEPSASPEVPAEEPSAVLQEAETAYTAAEPDPADLQTRNLTADQARSSELGYTVYTDGRNIYFYGTAGNENTPHWYIQTADGWQPAADSSIESSVRP